MTKRFSFFIALLVLGAFYSANAVEVRDLYLVKLPVAEQGRTVLWNASVKGFKEVLVRKSGSSAILTSDEVQRAYRKVTSYLQRFEYASQEDNQEYPYEIALYFEPRLIDSLIQDAQMPLWGSNRPLTILWLAIEEDRERKVVLESAEEDSVYAMIKENATRRGLPVILPLMDLEDEQMVSISDIWGRFPSAITRASQRYPADVISYGRINQIGDNWQGKFGYINQEQEISFEAVGESKQQLIANMMDNLADRLCEKYCVVQEVGQKNEVLIRVSDISSFKAFKAAESYLSDLSSVNKVAVISVDKYDVLFKLTLLGQVNSTIEGIGLSKKMIAIEPPIKANEDLNQDGQNGLSVDQLIESGGLNGTPENQLGAQTSNDNNNTSQTSTSEQSEAATEGNSSIQELVNQELKGQKDKGQEMNGQEVTGPKLQTLYYRWIG